MHIHFVCTGNTYRSRIAEAYLNSKKLSQVQVSSSGTEAKDNICGPVCWEAQRLLEASGLVEYMSLMWTQTNEHILNSADFIVFMEQQEYACAKEHYHFISDNYAVWNILDLDELATLELTETIEKVQASEKTFSLIKEKVDELITTMIQKKNKG